MKVEVEGIDPSLFHFFLKQRRLGSETFGNPGVDTTLDLNSFTKRYPRKRPAKCEDHLGNNDEPDVHFDVVCLKFSADGIGKKRHRLVGRHVPIT
jgi:hypothetical protein